MRLPHPHQVSVTGWTLKHKKSVQKLESHQAQWMLTKAVIGKRLPLRTSAVNRGPFITDETHPFCWDPLVTVAQRWLFWILEEPLLNSPTSPKSHVQVITDGTSDLKDCWVMRVMPWGISRGESLGSLMICPRTSGDAHQIRFWS